MKFQQDIQNTDKQSSSPYDTEIQDLANRLKLGKLQSSYTQSTSNGLRLLINAIVWFLISAIGLFFLVDAIRKITLATTLSDPPTLRSIGGVAAVSVLVLFGCFLQGWRNLREYNSRHREQVHIFEDGFVFLQGRLQSHALRWDTIEGLLRGTLDPKHPHHVRRDNLTFITDKDVVLLLEPKVQQRSELCDAIEQTYTDYRRPGMLELYRLGEELEFSDLIVHQDGVSYQRPNTDKEETLDWDEIDTFEVGETYTRITAKTQTEHAWFEELTADIENARILKELLPTIWH